MQQRIVQGPRNCERPESDALLLDFVDSRRRILVGRLHLDCRAVSLVIERYGEERVANLVFLFAALQALEFDALFVIRAIRLCCKLQRFLVNPLIEF